MTEWHETPAAQSLIRRMFTLTRIAATCGDDDADELGTLSKDWEQVHGLVHRERRIEWIVSPASSECGELYDQLERKRFDHIDAILTSEGLAPRWFDAGNDKRSADRYTELCDNTPTLSEAIEQWAKENVE